MEYANALGRDLSFQFLQEELDPLEKTYTGTQGELLAAVSGEAPW